MSFFVRTIRNYSDTKISIFDIPGMLKVLKRDICTTVKKCHNILLIPPLVKQLVGTLLSKL